MTGLEEVTNWEIFVLSLGLLGGARDFVDVEDVFVKCFELAPRRFSWRTRADLPDYKKCSKALRDAEARSPQLLVKTADGFKRRLTVEGQKWVAENEVRYADVPRGGRRTELPKSRPQARMLADIERSDTFREWSGGAQLPAEKWRYAELLHCAPDSQARVWRDRLQVLRAAAFESDRKPVLRFLEAVASAHEDWFRDGET